MREFGGRVAEISPYLATAFCGIAVLAWASTSAPAAFWLGNATLGLLGGFILVRLYRTEDAMYVFVYTGLVAVSTMVARATLESPAMPLMLGGLAAFLGVAAVVIAVRRRSVLVAAKERRST